MSLTILVADDEEAILRAVRRFLERAGHEIHTATTADEAIALIHGGPSFDVALVDANMPGGGPTVLRALEAADAFRGRMFLMTGSLPGEAEDVPPGVLHLQKPFDFSGLAARVEQA